MPSSISRFLTSASASISCNAPLSLLTISGGVPAGANSAFQETTAQLATPLSCNVAMSGVLFERTGPDDASARNLLHRRVAVDARRGIGDAASREWQNDAHGLVRITRLRARPTV
jgi:hypothetical protein